MANSSSRDASRPVRTHAIPFTVAAAVVIVAVTFLLMSYAPQWH